MKFPFILPDMTLLSLRSDYFACLLSSIKEMSLPSLTSSSSDLSLPTATEEKHSKVTNGKLKQSNWFCRKSQQIRFEKRVRRAKEDDLGPALLSSAFLAFSHRYLVTCLPSLPLLVVFVFDDDDDDDDDPVASFEFPWFSGLAFSSSTFFLLLFSVLPLPTRLNLTSSSIAREATKRSENTTCRKDTANKNLCIESVWMRG